MPRWPATSAAAQRTCAFAPQSRKPPSRWREETIMNPMRMRPRELQAGTITRRTFLKATAATGAGLTLGLYVHDVGAQAPATPAPQPNAFIRIGTDNTVTVIVKHLEMGQGTFTG